MDRRAITTKTDLENILFNKNADPRDLSLSLLREITSGFSIDKQIGYGGFAVVYKGMLGNGMVAVKKLSETLDINDKAFELEVRSLMMVKHKNIVRFLGYCSDTQGKMVYYEGKFVLADVRERLLCFEYLPNGSLDKQITDASTGLEWKRRYQIIKAICEGLYYLHKKHIVHRDLKPANILLDANMMPKIADFGLSRIFNEKQTRDITSKLAGTFGYLAPEFSSREVTFKLDIYSLGVIIMEIVTGVKGYVAVKDVLDRWTNRLENSKTQLLQVQICTEIALECTKFNPAKRPDTKVILARLGATQIADEVTETGESSSSSVVESPLSLERTTYKLPSRSLAIAWGDNPQFWRWISDAKSGYGECAELLSVYSLVVSGEITPKDMHLPAATHYTVYLVYRMAGSTSGLRGSEQTSMIKLYGERVIATSRVCLHPPSGSRTDDVTYPKGRGDGWLELKLGKFDNKKTVIVELRQENAYIEKSGLIIAGMEVRIHEVRTN